MCWTVLLESNAHPMNPLPAQPPDLSISEATLLIAQLYPEWMDIKVELLGVGRRWQVFRVIYDQSFGHIGVEEMDSVVRVRVHDGVAAKQLPWIDGVVHPHTETTTDGRYTCEARPFERGQTIEAYHRKCDPSQRFVWLPSLLATMRRLHGDPCHSSTSQLAPRPSAFVGAEWVSWVEDQLRDALSIVDLPQGHLERNLSTVLGHLYRLEPVRASFLHGDLSPRNVLLRHDTPSQVAALIDWDDSRFGDYMWDVAGLATFYDEREHMADVILQLYHEVDAGSKAHMRVAHRFWLYYLAISCCKLALHYRSDPTMDLTRGMDRARLAATRLESLRFHS